VKRKEKEMKVEKENKDLQEKCEKFIKNFRHISVCQFKKCTSEVVIELLKY
jgi:hypothetical protein